MNKSNLNYCLQALLAGVLIGLGDIVYVVNSNHLIGAFLFSLGLLTILMKGYPLYTGRIGFIEGVSDLVKPRGGMVCLMLLNFLGIALTCSLANVSRLDLSVVENVITVKLQQPWYSALFLSWGCGVMMYIAVSGWRKTANPLFVILPIMFFILCGFEHCIANFGYFWMWITADGFTHCSYRLSELPLGFSLNLCVMILGNALGSLTFSKI